jgi:DNA-binding response OmpR family regulator
MNDQPSILIVEDSEDHVFLLQLAFKKADITNPVRVAPSGAEAIAYLGGTGKYSNWSDFPLPAIVLLDLKMPGIDGFGVLRWVRAQPGLKCLRVIMLTSSDLVQEVTTAYELGAQSFLTKPVDLDKLVAMMRAFKTYWLDFDRPGAIYRSKPDHAPGSSAA